MLSAMVIPSLLSLGCIDAAEFQNSDVIPEVSSVVFAREFVAITVEPRGMRDANTDFFLAPRDTNQFLQISADKFSELLGNDHFHRQLGRHHESGVYMGPHNQLARRRIKATEEECTRGDVAEKFLESKQLRVTLKLNCSSSISDALIADSRLWIGTIEYGDHGEYGAEGLVVTTLDGGELKRIDTGEFPLIGLAQDPWTKDIWAVSRDRVSVISLDYSVRWRYWPVHKFDAVNQKPDSFVVESSQSVSTDALAILAYDLGEAHYQRFSHAIKDLPRVDDDALLQAWYMSGPDPRHRPLLPAALGSLVANAEATYSWKKFVCLLGDDEARRLCALPLEKWPESSH